MISIMKSPLRGLTFIPWKTTNEKIITLLFKQNIVIVK